MPPLTEQVNLLRRTISRDYTAMLREPGGALKYPFIVPGSAQYLDQLWDWDSWLTNIALRQIAMEQPEANEAVAHLVPYERGCILNFLSGVCWHGWMPVMLPRAGAPAPENPFACNMHKPVLAQHAAFLVRESNGDAEWLREHFYGIQAFLNNYRSHHRHTATGLYFWQDDAFIGVDNDPCTYGRPPRSSGSIYLNSLMYRELLGAEYIARCLGQTEVASALAADAAELLAAIREHCWDEWTGCYYSVDLNVGHRSPAPRDDALPLHSGLPQHWACLIQRIGVWSNFLPLWAGIATPEQAARMAREHISDPRTFAAPAGLRSLSKLEKMYAIRASANPSSWLGPVWGVVNYLVFRGLVRYGLETEAEVLCDKTIALFSRDLERFGALHEYYEPETGEPLLNRGFQNWNYLVLNMAAWREGRPRVEEF